MYSKFLFFTLLIPLFSPPIVNAQILINEFNPKNPEWVEIINTSSSEINLSGYYFDDDADFNSDSGNSPKIPLQGLFPANNLCYVDMNSYLNDGGDAPTIFAPNGDVIDTYTYASSSANLSYSRIPDGGEWQAGTTFSKTQNACSSLSTPSPSPSPTSTPTQEPTQAPTASPTKTPTPVPTKTPTSKPTVNPTPTESTQAEESIVLEPQVLSFATAESSTEPEITETRKPPVLAFVFISLGIGFLGYGGYLLYNGNHAKNKETT